MNNEARMLKLFYKTLLVSFISGSLLLLDFSYKGSLIQMSSVSAETLKTDKIEEGSNIMATLTMAAVGLLASRLYKSKMTTDIMLAAAGGAAFIAGDIMAVFKNKEVIKDLETQITRDDKGKIDQKQIETLEKLKQSYVAAKDTATTKKMLQMAAAAAFAAAGISAYTMAATEQSMAATCMLGIEGGLAAASTVLAVCQGHTTKATAHQTKATAAYARPYCAGCAEGAAETAQAAKETAEAAACNKELAACTAKIGFDMTLLMSYQSTREIPSPSLSGLTTDTSQGTSIITNVPLSAASCANYAKPMAALEIAGACPAMATLGNQQNSGTAPLSLSYLNKTLYPTPKYERDISKKLISSTGYMDRIINFLVPAARADLFSPLGIASGLAIKFILATSTTLASYIDLNLLIPKRRAFIWGALAAASFAASSATGAEIGKIQENIDKIDRILNDMYAFKNGVAQENNKVINNPKIDKQIINNKNLAVNPNLNKEIDLNANGKGGPLPCVTGDSPTKCPQFSQIIASQNDVRELPEYVQQQVGSISRMADGLNGKSKISSSTLAEAQSLANQSAALRRELASKQKILQERIKASGSKQDLAKDTAKLQADMRAAVQKELKKNNTTAGAMLASFGVRPGAGTGADSSASDASKLADESAGLKGSDLLAAPSFALPAAAISAHSKSGNSEDEANANGVDSGDLNGGAAGSGKGSQTASMDDYDLKNDISMDKESSIFDLISNRYQKSGYPRLFKRVK